MLRLHVYENHRTVPVSRTHTRPCTRVQHKVCTHFCRSIEFESINVCTCRVLLLLFLLLSTKDEPIDSVSIGQKKNKESVLLDTSA